MKFADIPKFTPYGSYRCNVSVRHMQSALDDYIEWNKLEMNPDFQRGHVWTQGQQISYVEFFLKGGKTGRDIYFNCPGWQRRTIEGTMVCVDGLQRITALQKFMADELEIFGNTKFSDFEDNMRMCRHTDLTFHINDLETREEVLRWYLEMNFGGTPHTFDELERVNQLLIKECKDGI
jgi:hypothetical protein